MSLLLIVSTTRMRTTTGTRQLASGLVERNGAAEGIGEEEQGRA